MSCSLLGLAVQSLLLVSLRQQVRGDYTVSLRISSYSNPSHEHHSGGCCDNLFWCLNECDNYFVVCGPPQGSPCLHTGEVGGDSLSFTSYFGNLPNPIIFSVAAPWNGSLQVVLDVYDDDDIFPATLNGDEFVDQFIFTSATTGLTSLQGRYGRGTITYSITVSCSQNYFGSDCSLYCVAESGNHTCNSDGSWLCAEGWTGENCGTCEPRPQCSPHGGYCRQPGECLCWSGFSGYLCDMPTNEQTPATPTDMITRNPTDVITVTPTDITTAIPSDMTTGTPTDVITGTPTDITTAIPSDMTTGTPTDVITGTPTDITTAIPSDMTTGAPTDVITGTPTDITTAIPSDMTTGTPTDVTTGTPTETPVNNRCSMTNDNFNNQCTDVHMATVTKATGAIIGGVVGGVIVIVIASLALVIVVGILRTRQKNVSYGPEVYKEAVVYDYPEFPLPSNDPVSDAIVATDNVAYGIHTVFPLPSNDPVSDAIVATDNVAYGIHTK